MATRRRYDIPRRPARAKVTVACVVLAMSAAACNTWQVAPTGADLSTHETSQARITKHDGEVVVVRDPEFFSDSIRGFVPHPDSDSPTDLGAEGDAVREIRTTLPLSDVQHVETWDLDGLRSVGAAVGITATAAAATASLYFLITLFSNGLGGSSR